MVILDSPAPGRAISRILKENERQGDPAHRRGQLADKSSAAATAKAGRHGRPDGRSFAAPSLEAQRGGRARGRSTRRAVGATGAAAGGHEDGRTVRTATCPRAVRHLSEGQRTLIASLDPPCRAVAVVNPRAGVGRTTVTLGL
ncbi:MAG TPA: hypothetical protein VIH33_07590, partial [Candidatus Limnocylindria bacterium]